MEALEATAGHQLKRKIGEAKRAIKTKRQTLPVNREERRKALERFLERR